MGSNSADRLQKRTPPRRPPSIDTTSRADTPSYITLDSATLPPEDVQLKRDVAYILKWGQSEYDSNPAAMKQHYRNLSNALEFVSDNKESVRYKLIRKAKLHVSSIINPELS